MQSTKVRRWCWLMCLQSSQMEALNGLWSGWVCESWHAAVNGKEYGVDDDV